MNLNQNELKNLEVFLSRVQLQGSEVGAFQEIVRALVEYKNTLPAEVEEVKPEEDKKK